MIIPNLNNILCKKMEAEESLDSPFNFYPNNKPSNVYFNEENKKYKYSEIFDTRNYFIISLSSTKNNNIIVSKQSLDKITSMINIIPEEYISFNNYKEKTKFNINLFEKEKNEIFSEEKEKLSKEYIINNEEDNDIEAGFKKVDNLEDNLFDKEIYKKVFWFYLFLLTCSIWNFLFYLYIIINTIYKSHFFTIYTLILSLLILFSGIFGLLKCKSNDFSGYILKISTILVPIFVIIGIIIYLATDVTFKLYWIKIIIDIITMILSFIIILFITGIIKAEIIKLNNDNNNNTSINQNLISNYKNISKENNENIIVKF